MTKVKITCGGYGRSVPGTKRVKLARLGEVIEVEDAEALRLASIGSAVILSKPKADPTPGAATGGGTVGAEGAGTAGTCKDTGEGSGATAAKEDALTGSDGDSAGGTISMDKLMGMKKDELLKMAEDMGVKAGEKMSKGDIAALILKAEAKPGEAAAPPLTGGSDIVV